MKEDYTKEQKKEIYTKKEVRELFYELFSQIQNIPWDISEYDVRNNFLKEKGLLDEEFKVGWYKDNQGRKLKLTEDVGENYYLGYGFDVQGIWNKLDDEPWCLPNKIPMTPSEVEEALKIEGDKLIGEKVKCLLNEGVYVVQEYNSFDSIGRLWYNNRWGDEACLMKDGKWAEIVEEPEEKKWEKLTLDEKSKKWKDYMDFITSETERIKKELGF